MLKLAVCSVDDVDHYVNTYHKNLEVKKNIELDIEAIYAKLEKGSGSVIVMNSGSQRDPFKRNASFSDLYDKLMDKNKQLNHATFKIKVVNHLLMVLEKTDKNGYVMACKRIESVRFDKIASELGCTKLQAQRAWRKTLARAILNSRMIQNHVKA